MKFDLYGTINAAFLNIWLSIESTAMNWAFKSILPPCIWGLPRFSALI